MEYVHPPNRIKTRKAHRCFGCCRDFPKGAMLTSATFKDGSIYTLYTCDVCEAVFAEWWIGDQQAGYCEGDLRYNDKEAWEEQRLAIEGEGGV